MNEPVEPAPARSDHRKPSGRPPAASAPAVPVGGLPSAPTPFVGRRDELKVLHAEIDRPGLARGGAPARGSRVLLIAGRPGSGRTALALHLAHQLADRYPDGSFFARLTGPEAEAAHPARVALDLLAAFGERADRDADPAHLAAAARAALSGRRVLLVLDDVAESDQLLALLPDGPGALVVATSQGPLTGVADARPCVLGGLDPASATAMLTHAIGSTRIVCDPRAAEELGEECGSHPTALRLVGGWLAARPKTSVADAAARLRSSAVEDPGPRVPLARAFQLVNGDLPPAVARLLRLLVLAPAAVVDAHVASSLAGCSPAAAGSVLADLAERGLLARQEGTEGEYRVPGCLDPLLRRAMEANDQPGEIQLALARMLERTVRLLGACLTALEPQRGNGERGNGERGGGERGGGERERTSGAGDGRRGADGGGGDGRGGDGRGEHGRGEEPPKELRFASPQAAALWLERRLPSLMAAARTAVDDGGLDTLARRLIAALVRVLSLPGGALPRDTPTEGAPTGRAGAAEQYHLHGLVLDIATRNGRHRERAAALINLADLDAAAGRRHEALDRYRDALAAARLDDDQAAAGRALESIGDVHRDLGDPQRAADWYGRALAVRESRGDLADQARLHGCLGSACVRLRQWPDAAREWRTAAALHRRVNDIPSQARAFTELARVLEYAGYPEESLRMCREALRWARHCQDVRLEAAVLLRMADTLDRLGDPAGARVQRAEAERLLSG
ncbi:hypothetical protein GCM10012280_51860 [Wenjunlia tyrosinilytica]|uniref:AAA+ ATPase domain-containing protein n=1 Tax=Wenjunlia tyrosinilytica TaxID=1544741 RepID=A0A917ZUW9_9ACTN|nr:hypothetical protein GCM10012280_51860 [Wenjunlia tyrosinilytica]